MANKDLICQNYRNYICVEDVILADTFLNAVLWLSLLKHLKGQRKGTTYCQLKFAFKYENYEMLMKQKVVFASTPVRIR